MEAKAKLFKIVSQVDGIKLAYFDTQTLTFQYVIYNWQEKQSVLAVSLKQAYLLDCTSARQTSSGSLSWGWENIDFSNVEEALWLMEKQLIERFKRNGKIFDHFEVSKKQ